MRLHYLKYFWLKYIFLLVVSVTVAACTSKSKEEPGLKLFVFDCGRLNYDSIDVFGISDLESDVRDLIVPCYVIEHEKGRLLWEGGLASSYSELEGWHEMDGGWRLRLDRTLASQLDEVGLSMSTFDFAAFSHFHFDHTGVANELIDSRLIIQKPEYDSAFADSVTVPGFVRSLYDNFSDDNILVVDGEHDVFGDGRVRLIPTPGHTSGHQVLFVDLLETGPLIVSGDLYIFDIGRKQRLVPSFNADSIQTLQSMDLVEALVEETGADVWITHELVNFTKLRKAPLYHQ